MKWGGVIIFRRRFKSLIWTSIFLMLFSVIAPYLASAAESGAKGGEQPATFSDIQSHWAYKEIMELSAANIVNGFKDGTFKPTGNVTREEFLKMLVELRKLPKESSAVLFNDVKPERWSVPYIAAGLTNGILLLADFPDGFKPSQPITRNEMAVWIVRALQLPPQKEEKLLGNVKDQADIKWNRDLIEAALGTGIIRGNPDGTFKGGNNSTRAEAAVMLVRALHYSPGQTPTTPTSSSDAPRKIVEYKPEVKQSNSTNYSKRDEVTWVINDPNLKLEVGDVFVMPPNDKYFGGIAKKVVSISREKGALVVKTSVPRLREVFSKLDVHAIEAINPKMLVPADPSIQIKMNEVSKLDTSLTLPCFNIAMNNANYEGLVLNARMNFCNLGVIADIGLDIDVDWFDVDLDFYSKLVLTGDITTNVTLKADTGKGDINKPKFIPLTAPFYVPVFTGVFVKGQLYLRIDPKFGASLEIKFEDKFHLEQGFTYSSNKGFQAINKTTNTATLDVNSKVNASLAAGPDFQLTLTLLDIAYAGIELYPGIRADFIEQEPCDAISVSAFLKLDVIAGYDVWVADGKISKTLVNLDYLLFKDEINCAPPQPPNNLNAKLIGVNVQFGKFGEGILDRTDVELRWDTVSGATSYNVKRSDAPGGPFKAKRSNLKGTTYTDTTASKGNTYYYQVTAGNENGEGAPSRILPVTVVDMPPQPPVNLTAVRSGGTAILNWDKIGGFITYNVKRAEGSSNTYETIASNINESTFTDTAASILKGYSYIVTALDRGGESEISNKAYVTKGVVIDITPVTPQVPIEVLLMPAPDNFIAEPHSGKVVLSWNAVNTASGYNVKRSNATDGTYVTIGSKVSDTTFTDTTVENGKTYYYKVTALNNIGNESKDSLIKEAKPVSPIDLKDIIVIPIDPVITVNPLFVPTPGNFNASTDINSGKVILSWNAVEGATGYNVMRSGAANGTYEAIGSKVSGTTFTDSTAAIGTTNYYKITAVNNKGAESKATPIKSATRSSGIR
ncbi:S-layer homology domain-containing protein [Cohnella sp. WQ 127256]|uniref:S-layer homology domain-containing protein n=1 Tax=Cohnella sp. WQ 127256 TaxID=2938790 RepID=UPI0021175121|nr:S-layer homology domain-containing protein [Cohnella sp. WQ 127256]